MFLTKEELVTLTGFRRKSTQIAYLKRIGIAFTVNASGHPVVAKAAVEGQKKTTNEASTSWRPKWAESRQ